MPEVHLPEVHFLVPAGDGRFSGGSLYDGRMAVGLAGLGRRVREHAVGGDFPGADAAARHAAGAVLAAIADGAQVVVDGLLLAGLAPVLRDHARRLCLVALVHMPIGRAPGLDPGLRRRLQRRERAALAGVARILVPSARAGRTLLEAGVPAARLAVVEPGTDPAPRHAGSGGAGVRLLCVAALRPGKGHADLIEALAGVGAASWELDCVGDVMAQPMTVGQVRRAITRHNLEGRVRLTGEVAHQALGPLYHGADVFVSASAYESYGMALAEALARGLPVVATRAGGLAEAVPADAGVLVTPGDVGALAGALDAVIGDAALRARLAAGAGRAGAGLPDWRRAAACFAAELDRAAPP